MPATTPTIYRTYCRNMPSMCDAPQPPEPRRGWQNRIYRHHQRGARSMMQPHLERREGPTSCLKIMAPSHTTMQAGQNPSWPVPRHHQHWGEPSLPQDIHLPVDPTPALSAEMPARFVPSSGAPRLAARQNDGRSHSAAKSPSASDSHAPLQSAIPAGCVAMSDFAAHVHDHVETPYWLSQNPGHK